MLCSLKEVIEIARKKNMAVGAINTPNSETLIAVLEAAEQLDVPIIISHAQLHEPVVSLERIGPMMVALAKASKAKVCVHLDHGEDFEYCKRAIELGFSSIMIDYSTKSYEDNVRGTAEMVKYAHAHGVDVEAELGAMPNRESGGVGSSEDIYTKVELVPDFIKRTNVDALAIAFGTAHGIYKVTPKLNFDIITKVREVSNIPLVMHGGSGVSTQDYKEVIKRGINKINYYTYMSYDGYKEAKEFVSQHDATFYHDLALAVTKRKKEHILKILKVFADYE